GDDARPGNRRRTGRRRRGSGFAVAARSERPPRRPPTAQDRVGDGARRRRGRDPRCRDPPAAGLRADVARPGRAGYRIGLLRRAGGAHRRHRRPDPPRPLLFRPVRQAGQGLRHRLAGRRDRRHPQHGPPLGRRPRRVRQPRPRHRPLPRLPPRLPHRRHLRPQPGPRRRGRRRRCSPVRRPDRGGGGPAGNPDRDRRRPRRCRPGCCRPDDRRRRPRPPELRPDRVAGAAGGDGAGDRPGRLTPKHGVLPRGRRNVV
ncbi:MAG: Redox-sensing transcriptional repressor Rex, partial [uncultured Thermomicrobiales bacterium]